MINLFSTEISDYLVTAGNESNLTRLFRIKRGKTPPPTSVLIYDTKKSGGEVPVMLEFWGTRSTSLSPSLSGPL